MSRILRALAWAGGGLGLLLLVVGGVGLLLPVAHTATVERVVPGTPDAVWATITDVAAMPTWRPGIEQVERLPDVDGLPVWRESGPTGSMTLRVTAFEPPRRLRTTIADEDLPFGGSWTYELDGEATGTRVTLTEDGEVYNPMFRFVSRFVLGHDATMIAYLDGLQARMSGAR